MYEYRLTLWGGFGESEPSTVANCTLPADPAAASRRKKALAAAVGGAGGEGDSKLQWWLACAALTFGVMVRSNTVHKLLQRTARNLDQR